MTRVLVDQEFHKGDVVRIIEEGNKYYGFKATVKYSSTYGDGYDLTLEDGTYAATEQYGVEAWKEDTVTEFKVGDRIVAIDGAPPYFYKNDTGTVTRVGSLRDSLQVKFDKKHRDGIWYIPRGKAKLVTEPDEEPTEEPAKAPVTPEEDEWWTVEDPRDVVMPEEAERAASFGLEIRVQVRRKL